MDCEPDDAEAWELVRQEVLAGRPTMLSGDIFYLDYREYKVHFPGHRFVLVGFDDEREIAFIADRINVEPEACSYPALFASRNPPEGISTHNLWGRFHGSEPTRSLEEAAAWAIERCSRSNTSGTYSFFRDAVCGKGTEFKKGATTMTGSAAVVDFVKTTPNSIGYSGMGYKTDDVKWLKVSSATGEAVDPTSDAYPISRKLYGYTIGAPEGAAKEYIDWCRSDAGQKILEGEKFVPLPPEERTK